MRSSASWPPCVAGNTGVESRRHPVSPASRYPQYPPQKRSRPVGPLLKGCMPTRCICPSRLAVGSLLARSRAGQPSPPPRYGVVMQLSLRLNRRSHRAPQGVACGLCGVRTGRTRADATGKLWPRHGLRWNPKLNPNTG